METLKWLENEIKANGLICEEYDKVQSAKSKKQIFEVCCSAKGIDFLPMMRAKGHPLDYGVIYREFCRYINGLHKPEYGGEEPFHTVYTSALYCRFPKEQRLVIDTTIACLLDCEGEVYIEQYNFARLCVDQNCKIRIHCPKNSHLIVEYWGDRENIEVVEGAENVKFKEMRDDE